MAKKKILIQLSDEDSEFFSELLARDDIEIVSDEADAEFTVIEQSVIAKLINKIDELSDEKGKIAQELKNPLASVKGYADVLLSGMTGELTEQQENFLQIIKSNANQMQVMIDDMRDTAKFVSTPMYIDKSPFEIMPMINETVRPFERVFAEKQHSVAISAPDDLPLALGDDVRFIQVLTNLISNAHKYSNEGDTIGINVRVIEDFIQISVTDMGIGIREEDLEKIFSEKYFRAENSQNIKGTGLGMMLSKHLVEAMNGEIWVESELGKGSTFYFTIPIAIEDVSDD